VGCRQEKLQTAAVPPTEEGSVTRSILVKQQLGQEPSDSSSPTSTKALLHHGEFFRYCGRLTSAR
jgi:hypothetical protein